MPRPLRVIGCLVAAALLLAAPGCDGKPGKKKGRKGAAAVVEEKLPAVDPASSLTVDSGRLLVSSPEGWHRGPRSKEYLVRYSPTTQQNYPFVTVTAADPPDGFDEVTAANHDAFVEAVAADLDPKPKKPPQAVKAGRHRAVAYAAAGRASDGGNDQPVDRSYLVLVVNGRLVTVEARAAKGDLDDAARDTARAVAASLAVPQGPAAGGATPAP